MSFFKKLFKAQTTCPLCGSSYAHESFAGIRCTTSGCKNCDPTIKFSPSGSSKEPPADFTSPIEVLYTNFRGEQKCFKADRNSFRVKGPWISLRVAPTGGRITLKAEKILNCDVMLQKLKEIPSSMFKLERPL